MRIRTVKPEFWTHAVMAQLPAETQLMALALLNMADDHGYFEADPRIIRGSVMPFREDLTSVSRDLRELVRAGWVELRTTPGHGAVGRVVNWARHQRVAHPAKSKLQVYFDASDASGESLEDLTSVSREPREEVHREQGTGNRERNREQGKEQGGPKKGKPKKAQVEIPGLPAAPEPTPRPPSRIAKLHAEFIDQREGRLMAPVEHGGLGMETAPPDEPPNWVLSAAALGQWVKLLPDRTPEEQDRIIAAWMGIWLETPYWASPPPNESRPAPTPYPWGAFISPKQWERARAEFDAQVDAMPSPVRTGGVH